MSSTQNDKEKVNNIFNHLAMVSGLNIEDTKNVFLINAAIHYADIDKYILDPQNIEDAIANEMFSVKAVSYLKRKTIPFIGDNYKYIRSIINWEYEKVSELESKLKYL